MVSVTKISEIKTTGSYEYNGSVINVTEVTDSGKLRGVCKLADGTEFKFTNSASGLNGRINNGGKTIKKAVIPCGHADHSTCHGEHRTIISGNRIAKKHRSIMRALSVINDFVGYQDDLNIKVNEAWHDFKNEQNRLVAEAEQLRLKRETEAKEAEAKKLAEAEAKKQAELVRKIGEEQQVLLSFGMNEAQVKVMLEQKYGAEVLSSVF